MSKKSRAKKSNFANRYTGELATPIYEPVGWLGESEAEFKRRLAEQLASKFNKLFDWYGIDLNGPDAGMYLALNLALAYVPGMQVRLEPRKRGRKPSWKNGLGIALVRDVDALQQAKKMTYRQAIAKLRKDKEKPWGAYELETLITRHREARRAEQRRQRLTEQLRASPLWKWREVFVREGFDPRKFER